MISVPLFVYIIAPSFSTVNRRVLIFLLYFYELIVTRLSQYTKIVPINSMRGCGSGLTWTYREGTKTLTISGTGEIDDDSIGVEHGAYVTRAPWFPYHYEVTKIVFENGVKRIGQNAFRYFKNVTKLEFPRSLESIGPYAFLECKLITVTMHNNVAVIGKGAFFKQNGNKTSTIYHVYYDGSEYEWNNIVIAQDNEPLTGAAIHYNSAGPATDPGTQPDSQPAAFPTQDEAPVVKLSFFERIIQMILDFFARLFGR